MKKVQEKMLKLKIIKDQKTFMFGADYFQNQSILLNFKLSMN